MIVSACSNTTPQSDSAISSATQNKKTIDSYENINRKIFAFNKGLDKVFLKPSAKVYKAVTPKFVDKSIGNVLSNLDDVGNVVNNALQGKGDAAVEDVGRVIVNSTAGLAGIIDVASAIGFEKHNEDFGQTLAKWGVKSGPYVMLPFFGPSTVRDASARLTVDRLTDLTSYHDEGLAVTALDVIKERSDLFAEEEFLKNLSEDQYSALRDLWLQNRESLIRDGESDVDSDADLIDELESLDL